MTTGASSDTSETAPHPSPLHRLVALGRDIKLSHSIFALPFALLATFLAAASVEGSPRLPSAAVLALIVACMVLARTVAMTVNRLVDARLDAANPRTANRAIPSGRLSRRFAAAVAMGCTMLFILATGGFYLLAKNPWPALLSPLVLAWLCFYSFTKRFTMLCHIVLGSAPALSPLAAVIAVRPAFLAHLEPHLIAVVVICWVAGFDVLYALQDVAVDRHDGLHSMPARLGVEPALWISRALHAIALTALIFLARCSPMLGTTFAAAVGIVAALLILEHAIVWRSRTRHINIAFFTVNGVISLVLGGAGILDVVRTLRL